MRLLVLLSRIPYPLEKGDKLRAFHLLKELHEKHEIILFCTHFNRIDQNSKDILKQISSHQYYFKLSKKTTFFNLLRAFFSSKPFQVHFFYQKKAQKRLDKIIEKHLPNHIFCQLIRTAQYARKYSFINKSIDYMDCLSAGMHRRSTSDIFPLNILFKKESKRLKEFEQTIQEDFDNLIAISEQDKKELNLASEVQVIHNGIDLNYFFSEKTNTECEYDLVFVGNLSYYPNVECAKYIAKQIYPHLKKQKPNIKILISGATPNRTVLKLQNQDITVQGWTKDIRKVYTSAKIFFAPLHHGSGLQNKLLEAMALKRPCITSELANGALRAENEKEILTSNSKERYINLIFKLLEDSVLRKDLAEHGYKYIKKTYSWKASAQKISQLILN